MGASVILNVYDLSDQNSWWACVNPWWAPCVRQQALTMCVEDAANPMLASAGRTGVEWVSSSPTPAAGLQPHWPAPCVETPPSQAAIRFCDLLQAFSTQAWRSTPASMHMEVGLPGRTPAAACSCHSLALAALPLTATSCCRA